MLSQVSSPAGEVRGCAERAGSGQTGFPQDFRDESPRMVAEFLALRGLKPSKALGQNFLADGNVLDRIVEESGVAPGVGAVEVGPGLGALTARLLKAGASVVSIEKDKSLQPLLAARFAAESRFRLVCGDALDTDWATVFSSGATHLVSNLPYSVGSRVVVDAATCRNPPRVMVLLLQKEVAQRFAALEGTGARGAVSVVLQRLYDVRLVRDVAPSCFVPRPEVVSAVVSLRRHDRHALGEEDAAQFNAFVKTAFLHRRKQLASALRSAGAFSRPAGFTRAALEAAGAAPTARAEDISLAGWLALAEAWRGG